MVLAFGLGILVSLPAMAATVEVVKGKVLVNQGQGYKEIAAARAVSTGDQVMASPASRGRILYADGCAIDVGPGAVVTVPDKCYQPMRAGLEAPVEQARPFPWVPVLGAAAVIGVGACAVSGCFDDDDNGRRQPPGRSPDGGR
jgi:hypothetical protein